VGVAKAAKIVGVKVLNKAGSGSWSAVIAGINFAAGDCKQNRGGRMCVVSMSLGGALSASVNAAVERATAAGLVVAVAAGNSNSDACRVSPASAPSALTVGATTKKDARASFSSWGPCVDIYAPGVGVTSSLAAAKCPKKRPSCYATFSGTSMATPHVAGVAAVIWSQLGPEAAGAEVSQKLLDAATGGVIRGAKKVETPLLAFNRIT
jgi:subtilisin family serine protease